MKIKKITGTLSLLILINFIILPINIKAFSIRYSSKWTAPKNSNGLNLKSTKYKLNGIKQERNTAYIGGFRIQHNDNPKAGTDRAFCVQPQVHFDLHNDVSGYSKYTPSTSVYNKLDTKSWLHVKSHEDDLKKVLSCWSENTESVVSEQVIVWELVTNERTKIDYKRNLTGTYAPQNNNSKSLNKLIKSTGGDFYEAYKSILRCAARFDVKPSFTESTKSSAESKAKELSNYDDSTQTFSQTFSNKLSEEPKLLKYYKIKYDDRLDIKKSDSGITVKTKKVISKKDPAAIIFTYAYKDDGKSLINSLNDNYNGKYDDGDLTYYLTDKKTDSNANYQALVRGHKSKTVYLYVWTDDKPEYQIKVRKIDNATGKPMSGIKFNIYSDAKATKKIGTTTATDKNGYATFGGISKIGKYYVREASTPDGYVKNTDIKSVTVKAEHKVGTKKYASTTSDFKNTPMIFTLNKKTIDENGKVISIKDYSDSNCSGTYIGAVFSIKKDNKYLNLTETSKGKYILNGTSSSENQVKTCNGKFNIQGIKSGCYEITETTVPEGYEVSKKTTNICVKSGASSTITNIYNTKSIEPGVSNVIFNKINENGETLDGGKYSLQKSVNGVYKDVLLKHQGGVVYFYDKDLKESDEGATYILDTTEGTINIKYLPEGQYRFVEKQAPDGYDAINDKDSTAVFTISNITDSGKNAFYQVSLTNRATKAKGSSDSAELIVTIITGRKVANYTLIIAGLAVLLTVLIIIRKKSKK